ncbi:MAG: sugar transferase [Flavobacteriales bacterium]
MNLIKIVFDYMMAIILLILLGWIMVILLVISFFDTKKWGFYRQQRIGKKGKVFIIFKIRTMINERENQEYITTILDSRITPLGRIMRKYKLDELPQLINIVLGDMSFVGPRPDVKGYADELKESDRIVLSVKPGITSPASLKYRNEEVILSKVKNPKKYNDEVIWPDKVRMNKEYVLNWSFKKDLVILYKTFFN